MLNQQQQQQHHHQQQQQQQGRMQMQAMLGGQQPGTQPGQVGSISQAMAPQQWFKQQQHLLALQRQQQHQQQTQQHGGQFQQPPAPPYQQRLPAIRQQHMGYNNAFNEQPYGGMQGLKPTPPPVPSPQGVMGPPHGALGAGGITVQQQQQLMQSVRSPPPIRSPQPNPSPRPAPSPRNQPIPSPRGPQGPAPSPHDLATSEMLLGGATGGAPGQNHTTGLHPHASPASGQSSQQGDGSDVTPMTPQDQLTKFVEQL